MKMMTTIVMVGAVAALAAIGFAYSGLYDVSASSPHGGLVSWFLSTTSHASIERRASNIDVPDLDDDSLILVGANDYNSMCAACHGAPGIHPEALGQGLNPPAPDLAKEAADMTPAAMFWVTKNGIRMTGMPSWGATHDDDAIWPVVAFMVNLPGLDEAAYRQLLADAEGLGHHGENTPNDHMNPGHHTNDHSKPPEDLPEAADEHDHESNER